MDMKNDPLVRLLAAYSNRFNTIVPSSQIRNHSLGVLEIPLEQQLETALREGRPVAEWEKELDNLEAFIRAGAPMAVGMVSDIEALKRIRSLN